MAAGIQNGAGPDPVDAASAARARMVREQLEGRGITDAATLTAMSSVPREQFMPPELRHRAYDDGAQSIGRGQTISQPYIVARMTEALAVSPGDNVLDVGTGSGYQAAVLATMGARVTSIERDEQLATQAADRLSKMGYEVNVVVGDGTEGFPQKAPYDGIVVAAAAPTVPEPLREQLHDGGRLVLPVGARDRQRLTLVRRTGDGYATSDLEPCVFVPLVGRHGFAR
jgi:protein-L-isoaspartate(D-aspartate) O-methyltransferase